jgi:2'-5' RNA ligase
VARVAQRRLYFALWPDDAVRSAIVAATAGAVEAAGGRVVPRENLHVTLAFLGGVPAPRYADAVAAARCVRANAAEQVFDRIATWGRGGPLVLEATHVVPALRALHEALANALVAADFALDRRSFRPHITLARAPARRSAPLASNVAWAYRAFALVESRTGPGGSQYTVTESFALA